MSKELIHLTSSTKQTHEGSVVRNFGFEDGTKVTEIVLSLGDEPWRLVQNSDGSLVERPDRGRYPFTERLAELAIAHYNETGEIRV